jgi:uncharacterized repeat protein (TIGR04138 family)
MAMPHEKPGPTKPIEQVVEEVGVYPIEAFEFVRRGLSAAVRRVHGQHHEPGVSRHVSGQQLCESLRDYALSQWGLLARDVLRHWNITRTDDFGRIVYALVNSHYMQITDEDSQEDFHNVFDFSTAFDTAYHIECKL